MLTLQHLAASLNAHTQSTAFHVVPGIIYGIEPFISKLDLETEIY